MNEKSWLVLKIAAGLYIFYLGFQIMRGMLSDRPENMFFVGAAGIVLLIAGAVILVCSAKTAFALRKRGREESEEAEGEEILGSETQEDAFGERIEETDEEEK